MKYSLLSIRVHISFCEEQIRFLQEHSDLPFSENHIFAKLFSDEETLSLFLELLKQEGFLMDESIAQIKESARGCFQENNHFILMFSDERSGSNRLEIESIMEQQDIVTVSIQRIRGLTMDMAWQFLMTSYPTTAATKAAAEIHTVPSLF